MANLLRAQVVTDIPGKIRVRAKAAPGREMDAKPIAGFYVRRRYAGDVFSINEWHEFSARWMEFIDEPPKEWFDKLKIREEDREEFMARAAVENAKTPQQRMQEQMISMLQAANPTIAEIDHSTGKVAARKSPGI